jgi:hypothetical protein
MVPVRVEETLIIHTVTFSLKLSVAVTVTVTVTATVTVSLPRADCQGVF